MIPEHTPAVGRAWVAAQTRACHLGCNVVESVHIMAGLLEESEGRPARLLQQAGFNPQGQFPNTTLPEEHLPAATQVPPSSTMIHAFDMARQLAGTMSADRTISSDHLLWAVLHLDAALRESWQAQGLNWETLESTIKADGVAVPQLDEPLELAEPQEWMDTARILDACANRSREGLRVVEDYCRFALNDRFLIKEWKRLRHDLAEALATLSGRQLLEARDTLQDVGTTVTTDQEQQRHSLLDVAQTNIKRLQEALRSLEEYGKLHSPLLGESMERLRYHSYTLERAVVSGATARERLADARLYVLLTGANCTATLDWMIQEAAAGGAQIIQLREKDLSDRELIERARNVRRWTRQAGVLFIVNDRPDIARLADADGVHLGQDDLPVSEARRIIGPDGLIGVSTHSQNQLHRAILDGASYVGVGPTFPSKTKQFDELPGLAYVKAALAETTLPAFVIGGVSEKTIHDAVAAGARRVAVSQAIAGAEEPRQAAAALRRVLNSQANRTRIGE